MDFIGLFMTALGSAITDFIDVLPKALVGAFDGLFIAGTGEAMALTNLAGGFIVIIGISLVIACVVKVYHVFSGRARRTV